MKRELGMGRAWEQVEKHGKRKKHIAIQASLQKYVNEEMNHNMDFNGSGHQQIIRNRKWDVYHLKARLTNQPEGFLPKCHENMATARI